MNKQCVRHSVSGGQSGQRGRVRRSIERMNKQCVSHSFARSRSGRAGSAGDRAYEQTVRRSIGLGQRGRSGVSTRDAPPRPARARARRRRRRRRRIAGRRRRTRAIEREYTNRTQSNANAAIERERTNRSFLRWTVLQAIVVDRPTVARPPPIARVREFIRVEWNTRLIF